MRKLASIATIATAEPIPEADRLDVVTLEGKAWRIVKETESALNMQLLNRDGAHGSTLTDEGNKLLDAYLEVEERLQAFAEDEFAKLMK